MNAVSILFLIAGSCFVLQFFCKQSIQDIILRPERKWIILAFGVIILIGALRAS